MKVLILGNKGMLGQRLEEIFFDLSPSAWDLPEINITDQKQVEEKISRLKPEVVINAAAYTDVDKAEQEKELARGVNGTAVGYLSDVCAELGALFVHYSTDYVFAGDKKEGYREEDQPVNPVNSYGESKLLGEKKILNKEHLNYYLIRTSWLFGPGGKNFPQTILKLAREQKQLKVVDDQVGRPTYTLDLARKTRELIEQKKPRGIYHLTNQGQCSWYELAKEVIKIMGLKTEISPCSSQEFPRPAERPPYSILLNSKLKPLRPWEEALKHYLINNF